MKNSIIFFFILFNLPLHAQNRFDTHVPSYSSPRFFQEIDKSRYQSDCREILGKISKMIENMDLVYNMKVIEKMMIEDKKWYNHTFYNSSWIETISWVNPEGIMNATFVAMTTNDGYTYYFPYVPLSVYSSWRFATSPGDYYHENIASYSLSRLIPEGCK